MITAKCDHCNKDLGPVPIIFDQDAAQSGAYIVSPERNFKLRLVDNEKLTHITACSVHCAMELDKKMNHTDDLGTYIQP